MMTTRRPDKLSVQADTLLQKHRREKKGSRLVCVRCPLSHTVGKGSTIRFNVLVFAEVFKRLDALRDKRVG